PMKYKLFSELQRKDLDLFMFHEHGMPTGQLINDELACTDFNNRYKMLKSTLYNAVMSHVGKRDKDTLRIQMQEKRQVNEVFFKDLDNPKFWEADSLHYADERIVTEDLMKRNLSTNPKMIMFDACYNGSFHENDYIAGQYIFNDGQTLVAQGNTRNVLQDRWTIEMIGLLSHGVRAGQYNKL
ncbi:HEAT repeat domain-containing protein, partial [Bacteroides eggerthii]